MEIFKNLVEGVNNLLWGKNILVVLLIGAAMLATLGTKFMQFRLLKPILSVFTNEEKREDGISSIETFFLGTACRVGAGNIAGVVAAITVGGPGSLFWMWLVALFGAATSFIESTLSVIYREKNKDGNYIGGTPWIIKQRLKLGWLGGLYAIASIICYIGVTQVMSNSITESVASAYNIKQSWVSIALTIIVAAIIFGRGKKDVIIASLNKIVPVMAGLYLGVVLYIILTNISSIPMMIVDIFSKAFGTKEVAGGAIGIVIMQGVRRGLFSNEAGSGDSNYAAAVVDIDQPAKQGMVQALGVFVDTLLVCSATAFVVLLAGAKNVVGVQGMVLNGKELSGMALFQEAIKSHIGIVGLPFTVVVIFFFSLSTILAVTFYGRNALNYLTEKTGINIVYQILIILMVYIGGIKQNFFVWSLADFGLGIMTVINIICLTPIAKEAISELKKYEIILKEENQKIKNK
ncbi:MULTISPECIES: sodium:alanine symporter family protein [Fusobacterium]|uniref:alanine/glycine:cation symporter family protein n=1 Tax=Fusobacterium TaxID=848 RepID=UPI001476D50B|nr:MULTISPECIES: sodium:alanine symporter family protein [Fusobacterium]NME35290.1 sodium:alanine symporter family protein [Fusobacterium sp. FSA-380-WT-3A]